MTHSNSDGNFVKNLLEVKTDGHACAHIFVWCSKQIETSPANRLKQVQLFDTSCDQ